MCKLTLDWLERLLDLRILREVPVPGEFKYRVDGFFTVPPAAASLPHELFAHILPNQRVAVEVDGCVCVCVCVCACVCVMLRWLLDFSRLQRRLLCAGFSESSDRFDQ